jgi:hypothetical protein
MSFMEIMNTSIIDYACNETIKGEGNIYIGLDFRCWVLEEMYLNRWEVGNLDQGLNWFSIKRKKVGFLFDVASSDTR